LLCCQQVFQGQKILFIIFTNLTFILAVLAIRCKNPICSGAGPVEVGRIKTKA
jgi:hypothetical protein